MNAARARLEAFRESKKLSDHPQIEVIEAKPNEERVIPKITPKNEDPSILTRLFQTDFLFWLPTQWYRRIYESNPTVTFIVTGIFYVLCQIGAYSIGFGAVFFIFFCLLTLFFSLGQKQDGEISAYSVFNPGCERLPGQMTAEHFERDVIRRRM